MLFFLHKAFTFFLTASAFSAAFDLRITLTGPEYIASVGDLKVISTVTNDGQDTVNILREPNGALSNLPANKFFITNERNSHPTFIGIKAKYVPAIAAKSGQYTTLKPGESATTEHDLSAAYDFSTSGASVYTIRPNGLLYLIDGSGNIVTVSANTEHHITKIAANSAKHWSPYTAEQLVIEKRTQPNFIGCSDDQESQIRGAIPVATQYAKDAYNYLQSYTQVGVDRYTTWFGQYTDDRFDTVLDHFESITNNFFINFTYNCTCDESLVAYVYPSRFGKIWLCVAFWQADMTGTDSKGGTIVHEASHFNIDGGMDDHAYFQENCKNLAKKHPDKAVMNADTHEYFAENNPHLD